MPPSGASQDSGRSGTRRDDRCVRAFGDVASSVEVGSFPPSSPLSSWQEMLIRCPGQNALSAHTHGLKCSLFLPGWPGDINPLAPAAPLPATGNWREKVGHIPVPETHLQKNVICSCGLGCADRGWNISPLSSFSISPLFVFSPLLSLPLSETHTTRPWSPPPLCCFSACGPSNP